MRLEFAGKIIELLERLYAAPKLISYRNSYLQRLKLRDRTTLLDLGMGTAANTLLVLQQFPHIHVDGADRSLEMLQHSRKKLQQMGFASQSRFLCLDAHSLSLRQDYYDFAIVSQVLSYVQNPVRVLQELRSRMKPGGRILLEDSDWESFIYNSGDNPAWTKIRSCWLTQSFRIDGGRRLREFAHLAGLEVEQASSFHLQDDLFGEDLYGYWLAMIIADYAVRNGASSEGEVNDWLQTLKELSELGCYYFGLNRMCVICFR